MYEFNIIIYYSKIKNNLCVYLIVSVLCIYMCMCVCVYVYVCVCMCMRVCMHMCVYVCKSRYN